MNTKTTSQYLKTKNYRDINSRNQCNIFNVMPKNDCYNYKLKRSDLRRRKKNPIIGQPICTYPEIVNKEKS